MIQRFSQCEHAITTDSPIGWLQSDTTVDRGGITDRAAGVGADGTEAQPGCRGYAGPAGGDSTPTGCVPGINRHRQLGVIGPHRPFAEGQLAKDYGSRVPQLGHSRGVERGNQIREDLRAPHGTDATGVTEVLHADRYPVQRPPISPGLDLCLGLPRTRQRLLCRDRYVAVQISVHRCNPTQHLLGHLNRRDLPGLDECRNISEPGVVPIVLNRFPVRHFDRTPPAFMV